MLVIDVTHTVWSLGCIAPQTPRVVVWLLIVEWSITTCSILCVAGLVLIANRPFSLKSIHTRILHHHAWDYFQKDFSTACGCSATFQHLQSRQLDRCSIMRSDGNVGLEKPILTSICSCNKLTSTCTYHYILPGSDDNDKKANFKTLCLVLFLHNARTTAKGNWFGSIVTIHDTCKPNTARFCFLVPKQNILPGLKVHMLELPGRFIHSPPCFGWYNIGQLRSTSACSLWV